MLFQGLSFSIYDLWQWRGVWVVTSNGVNRSWGEFYNIEHWMMLAHGGGELESVCTISNPLDYGERS